MKVLLLFLCITATLCAKPLEPDYSPLPKLDWRYQRGSQSVLNGQCFVASKGGTNYKLGAVSVYLYPASVWAKSGAIVQKRYYDYRTKMDHLIDLRDRERDYEGSITLLTDLRIRESRLWEMLPVSRWVAKTDADGNFSIPHDIGEAVVVVARSRRLVGKYDEDYYWTVPVKAGEARVLLTNDNMGF